MLAIGLTSEICARFHGNDRRAVPGLQSQSMILAYSSRQPYIIWTYLHGADRSDSDSVNSKRAPTTGTNSSHNAGKWFIQ